MKTAVFHDATTDFPRDMTSEEWAKKFHTDDVSQPKSRLWHDQREAPDLASDK